MKHGWNPYPLGVIHIIKAEIVIALPAPLLRQAGGSAQPASKAMPKSKAAPKRSAWALVKIVAPLNVRTLSATVSLNLPIGPLYHESPQRSLRMVMPMPALHALNVLLRSSICYALDLNSFFRGTAWSGLWTMKA